MVLETLRITSQRLPFAGGAMDGAMKSLLLGIECHIWFSNSQFSFEQTNYG
jgi:hypothetical protein